jgi:hypothetical protein
MYGQKSAKHQDIYDRKRDYTVLYNTILSSLPHEMKNVLAILVLESHRSIGHDA